MASRIKGLKGLRADLSQVREAVDEGTQEAIRTVNDRAATEIAQDAPVDTGRLRRSVHADDDGVYVDAPYAGHVERRKPFVKPVADKMPEWLAEEAARDIEKGFPT